MRNGYTERFNDFVGLMRRHGVAKDKIIIEMYVHQKTEQIIMGEIDIVKIGIGLDQYVLLGN